MYPNMSAAFVMNILRKLLESYTTILVISLFIGLTLPETGGIFTPYTTPFLQLIFFLSSLKLNIRDVKNETKNLRSVLLVNLYMLILFPIAVYFLAKILVPSYAMPLLILATMPAGMTSVLFTELIGGSVGLALVLTTTTSLLAPFTVPVMIRLLAGASVAVPTAQMFLSLLMVIIVPFALAQIARRLFHEKIKASFWTFKPISIALLGCLIMGVVAREAPRMTQNLAVFLPALAILFVFFTLLHLAGYFGIPHLAKKDRLATTVCLTYMNFTLAIYLAGKFFPDPKILIPVILSVFPWSIGMIPFKAIVQNFKSTH